MLVNALLLELIGDLNFSCDRCVITSGLPEGFIALHPFPSDQRVLQRVVQGMAHMQLSCHIGWRHHNGKRFFIRINLCVEIVALHPHVINAILDLSWIVRLCKFFHSLSSQTLSL